MHLYINIYIYIFIYLYIYIFIFIFILFFFKYISYIYSLFFFINIFDPFNNFKLIKVKWMFYFYGKKKFAFINMQ